MVAGTNVIAVEMHQAEPDSSDLSFDLTLLATSTSDVLKLGFDFAIDPTTADDVLDAGTGAKVVNAIRTGPGTIGILNHPGEPDGNLDMWFAVTELSRLLSEVELDDLATRLRGLDDVLDARRIESGEGPRFMKFANLMVTLDEGASPGESSAIAYDFGQGVRVVAFGVPEPTTFTLAALGLLGCAFRWRRSFRIVRSQGGRRARMSRWPARSSRW